MDSMDNTQQHSPSLQEHEAAELMLEHVIQEDLELMYLHLCLGDTLSKHEESVCRLTVGGKVKR